MYPDISLTSFLKIHLAAYCDMLFIIKDYSVKVNYPF